MHIDQIFDILHFYYILYALLNRLSYSPPIFVHSTVNHVTMLIQLYCIDHTTIWSYITYESYYCLSVQDERFFPDLMCITTSEVNTL